MGKIIPTLIDRFDGGISEDKRSKQSNKFSLTKHFDVFTYPHKLFPYYKTEALETKNLDIVKFCQNGSTFYGFGVVAGSTKGAVYSQTADAAWAAPNGNNESSQNGRSEIVFFPYKTYIFMFRTAQVMRFDTAGGAWADSHHSLSWTNLAEPVHHPADDCAYFFYDNKVVRLNDSTWTDDVLTLPSNLKIVSACAYGNYLAIGCSPLVSGSANSIVFLWDRDSSLTTLTERIDFGEGDLVYLANLDNKLIGLINFGINVEAGLRFGKLLIKQANGQLATILSEITTDNTGYLQSGCNSIVRDNKMYFACEAPLDGDTRLGIWVIDSNGRFALDFIEEEATASSGAAYQGIYKTFNKWWIAHSNDGSVQRSDENLSYTITNPSIYESLIFNVGDSSLTKKLVSVTVMNEPISTSASAKITLKYRKDEETDWTTIFENTTDYSISHTAVNIESSGANLPQFKEIQFRIESIVGVIPTGFKFKSEIIDSDIN